MDTHANLDALCAQVGLATRYEDFWGHEREVPRDTLRRLLAAMSLPADSEAEALDTLGAVQQARASEMLPPVMVVRDHERVVVPVQWPPGEQERHVWTLDCEGGEHLEGPVTAEGIELPHTPRAGYHRLAIKPARHGAQATAHLQLIVCPSQCHQPPILRQGQRLWGPAIQLYALRSGKNWGIGDFSDLRRLLELASAQGAAFVGLNPLHALFPHEPERASPYSPSSRQSLNVLYIDVEAVPDFSEHALARDLVHSVAFQQRLQMLRDADMVSYDGVAAVKLEVLGLLYEHFRVRHLEAGTRRGRGFRAFQQARGQALRHQALFDALQTHFHEQDAAIWGWSLWPAEFRDPRSRAVQDFAREHEARVEFFEYLQWQAELQLQAAHARAESLGMAIGLYRDLAVGVNEGGSETWAGQSLYALGVNVGAPPEEYNPAGQDWGLPPIIPERLRALAYRPFIDTLRANMRHAGALRIDHVMALMRLFWVFPAHGAKSGAYMAYPFDDLMGILALESHRHRCLVIGEDLGTVPPRMRHAMREQHLLSYCPLLFERLPGGAFKPPADWTPEALAVVSTHDLPTLRGFWRGDDIDLRASLGLFPQEEQRARQVISRAQDRAQLLLALEHEGLMPQGTSVHPPSMGDTTPAFTDAVYSYLGRTRSSLVGVQLEDVTQQVIQVNVPGTSEHQYPNWRRKITVPLEDLAGDARWQSLAEALRQTRPLPGAAAAGGADLPALDTAEVPRATYRVQFHRGFTFEDAERALPYLQALGVSHLYSSPFLKARAGSTHGYDIIDHHTLNPEIGDEDAFERLCSGLEQRGMRQLLDIVPNHMGVLQADNAWWLDVLESGPASLYADTFDIDWQPPSPEMAGQVLLPVLGDHYGKVLEAGELQLNFDASAGEFRIHYHDHRFPVDPRDYSAILGAVSAPTPRDDDQAQALLMAQSLLDALANLPSRDDLSTAARAARHRDKSIHKRRLVQMVARHPWLAGWIDRALVAINGTVGQPDSFDVLDQLIGRQAYRLAYWRVAGDEVNYRRFFDINTLAALRTENDAVFEATHHRIFQWLQDGKLHGLRVDHPDGLADPQGYFTRLQSRHASVMRTMDGEFTPRALYVVVEKIMAEHERIPQDWPVHGGTGYRFINLANGLFVDSRHEEAFDRLYADFIGERLNFDEVLHDAKLDIMATSLASDLHVLTQALYRIAQSDRRSCDFTRNRLRAALSAMAAAFPVYRTYISARGVGEADRQHIDWATAAARRQGRAEDHSVIDYLRDVLLNGPTEPDPLRRKAMLDFIMRWQQFTAPVMAKSMEDTAFYRYHRLVSLNEVGGDPRHFGLSAQAFHAANQYRARFTPHTLLASSTHDTKRSEDVRARLNVLSEVPEVWRSSIARWRQLNRKRATRVDTELAPSLNDEYLLYQTLVGVWPLEHDTALDDQGLAALRDRVQAYMLKAVREAKQNTSWVNPNTPYETALRDFIDTLLGTLDPNPFLRELRALVAALAPFGCLNSLNQVLLKLTAPGVPDIYQGCEVWSFALVDPDNRRPVDLDALHTRLQELHDTVGHSTSSTPALDALLRRWQDDRLKMLLTWRLLQLRQHWPEVFRQGGYQVLTVEGPASAHVVAFARHHEGRCCVVIASRLLHTLTEGDAERLFEPGLWRDTRLTLPPAHGGWRDWLRGISMPAPDGEPSQIRLAEWWPPLPLAVLVSERTSRS